MTPPPKIHFVCGHSPSTWGPCSASYQTGGSNTQNRHLAWSPLTFNSVLFGMCAFSVSMAYSWFPSLPTLLPSHHPFMGPTCWFSHMSLFPSLPLFSWGKVNNSPPLFSSPDIPSLCSWCAGACLCQSLTDNEESISAILCVFRVLTAR